MDDEKQHYRGVLCLCCRQPIPLPAILISMESRLAECDPFFEEEHSHRVFTLRCRACEKEMPYRTSAILDIEGTPKLRHSQLRRQAQLLRENRLLSRAANA
jgi:hypothetical protein